ncbi:hypothetical protein EVAR_54939_1 [Eumeta japonica]|uniref:Uncharacterized protein n=1 Tax=Eumeta variegata TaxID=151549 RepID=A0A4C1YFT6_EUMVA|nr:hypothetical protein EVAR_54939_1 [Eumeta japonica]
MKRGKQSALMERQDQVESRNSAYRFETFSTVFQSKIFELHLMLTGLKTYNPLVHAVRCDILDIVADGREVRLFWVHTGTRDNERTNVPGTLLCRRKRQ